MRLKEIGFTLFGRLSLWLSCLGLCVGVLACAAGYVLLEDIVSVKTLATAMAFVGSVKEISHSAI